MDGTNRAKTRQNLRIGTDKYILIGIASAAAVVAAAVLFIPLIKRFNQTDK
jgi:hypothetical protein